MAFVRASSHWCAAAVRDVAVGHRHRACRSWHRSVVKTDRGHPHLCGASMAVGPNRQPLRLGQARVKNGSVRIPGNKNI